MNNLNRTITFCLLAILLVSFSSSAFAQSSKLSSKGGKTSFKYPSGKKSHGSFNKSNPSNKHHELHNKHFKSHKGFHNKHYKPHPGTKAYNDKYYGKKGYGKEALLQEQTKIRLPRFKPYGGNVYYGYNDYYPEDYYYDEIPYDGYGSTLGTVPERRSNLEANNYVYGPDYGIYPEAYPEEVYEYEDDYSYAPDNERRNIFIWTDEYGFSIT